MSSSTQRIYATTDEATAELRQIVAKVQDGSLPADHPDVTNLVVATVARLRRTDDGHLDVIDGLIEDCVEEGYNEQRIQEHIDKQSDSESEHEDGTAEHPVIVSSDSSESDKQDQRGLLLEMYPRCDEVFDFETRDTLFDAVLDEAKAKGLQVEDVCRPRMFFDSYYPGAEAKLLHVAEKVLREHEGGSDYKCDVRVMDDPGLGLILPGDFDSASDSSATLGSQDTWSTASSYTTESSYQPSESSSESGPARRTRSCIKKRARRV
jgi:hypothetical protein